jgi:hypothetical protein
MINKEGKRSDPKLPLTVESMLSADNLWILYE